LYFQQRKQHKLKIFGGEFAATGKVGVVTAMAAPAAVVMVMMMMMFVSFHLWVSLYHLKNIILKHIVRYILDNKLSSLCMIDDFTLLLKTIRILQHQALSARRIKQGNYT